MFLSSMKNDLIIVKVIIEGCCKLALKTDNDNLEKIENNVIIIPL